MDQNRYKNRLVVPPPPLRGSQNGNYHQQELDDAPHDPNGPAYMPDFGQGAG